LVPGGRIARRQTAPRVRTASKSHSSSRPAHRPLTFVVYGVSLAWFAQHGKPLLEKAFKPDPWHRTKRNPSVGDILRTLRFALMAAHLSHTLSKHQGPSKSIARFQALLSAAV